GARYIDFFIPGLLGLNLMGSGIWSIAFAVVTARKQKLLKRLVATPMSRAQYLMSFLLSRLFFLVVEVGVLVGFGALVFGVPVRGSLVTLGGVCLVGALAFSAMGLLVASRARTVEAVSGLANLVMLPMWIFSGVFFSSANFPRALQPFIQALPLTGAVDALRAVMLRGATLGSVTGELLLLLAWLVVPFVLALSLFRWR
ncbi:MAG TPA: ABC transporter permease, partial [Gemmatimonadales bacterium]|nr:ABC transporter permease [Gemmatimonadales bacterium]